MAEVTAIAWCDATFNCWIGCQAISPGCDNCYAAAYAKRVGRDFATRTRTSAANWAKPLAWQRHAERGYLPDGKTPHGGRSPRVFCASLADVFDNEAPDDWREMLWALIRATPALTWLLLTKRIGNVLKMAPGGCEHYLLDLGNVWIGATIVNQEEADRDVPKLLKVRAAKRFVSYEPALGLVDWTKFPGIDWIICGGESTQGAKARPFDVEFARATIRQCREIGASPFIKQLGSHATTDGIQPAGDWWPRQTGMHDTGHGYFRKHLADRAGADPAEWPPSLRVQEFPPC